MFLVHTSSFFNVAAPSKTKATESLPIVRGSVVSFTELVPYIPIIAPFDYPTDCGRHNHDLQKKKLLIIF